MNHQKLFYMFIGMVIAIVTVAIILGIAYPALANGVIYIPGISNEGDKLNEAAVSQAITPQPFATAEPPDFVPTPLPPMPTLALTPLTPGQPATIKERPSQEELEKLAQPPTLAPDAPYVVELTGDSWGTGSHIEFADFFINDLVVIAKVSQVHAARWSTPDGKRPPNPHDLAHPNYIYTLVDIQVEQVLSGPVKPGDMLTISKNGGQIGEDRLIVDDYHTELAEGATLLLYLGSVQPAALPSGVYWRVDERYTFDPKTQIATNPYEQRSLSEIIAEIAKAKEIIKQQ